MRNSAVLDLFLGDSGKGKIVDYLAKDAIGTIRFNGSNNAGHTLMFEGKKYKTHSIPSGILYPHTINFIAHGCVINPLKLIEEIEAFKQINNKVFISGNAHIILPSHIRQDCEKEESGKGIGSTKQGVSPAYASKYARTGIQFKDLLLPKHDYLNKCLIKIAKDLLEEVVFIYEKCSDILKNHIVIDGVDFIHNLANKGNLVFEGAQGTFLDIDIGEYPFVTSSNCTVGAILTGTGLNTKHLHEVIGVIKAYGSYVGANLEFQDIKDQQINDLLCKLGEEFGTTTGRRRRLCWLDLDQIAISNKINGSDKLAITRMDTLGQLPQVYLKHQNNLIQFEPWGNLQHISDIDELPLSAQKFLDYIQKVLKTPIWAVGTGPSREQLLIRKD